MKKITLKGNIFIRLCSVLLLLFVLIFGPVFTHFVHAATTIISVFPSTVTASVGQNFSIDVKIANVFDLYGWEFKLSWNPILLDAVNITQGTFLKQGGNTFFANKINNTEGYLLADCTLLGNVPGVSGSGTLATVKFYVEGAGESVLDLYDTILVSSGEQSIPHESTDGYGYFTPPHDVAVTSIIASPTMVLPGQAININVTVQNQGSYAESFNVTAYYNSKVIETRLISLGIGVSTILTFAWNTTGINKGDYTLSAEASVVTGETDKTDNTKVDGIVTVLSLGHDVAVKGVTPYKTIVGQGYPLLIHITAKNYGSFTETFNVTAYANSTIIQTRNVTLTSGNSTTINFTWNTTGIAKGNYTINANATQVPGETDTTDNTYTDGKVIVTILGDVAPPFGKVNIKDIGLIAVAFGSKPGDPSWNPNADQYEDGKINIKDIGVTAIHFGEEDC